MNGRKKLYFKKKEKKILKLKENVLKEKETNMKLLLFFSEEGGFTLKIFWFTLWYN